MATPEVTPNGLSEAPAIAPTHRKNGRLSSCEPCRLAKYSCGHERPVCVRCTRRGIAQRCSYHPSPMTKGQGPPKPTWRQGRKGRPAKLATRESVSIISVLSEPLSPSEAAEEPSSHLQQHKPESQYLGSTSYSAVFQENKESMGVEAWGPSSNDPTGIESPESNNQRLKQAMSVLKTIPERDICDMLFDQCFTYDSSPLHEPAARYCLETLWESYEDALGDRDDEARLQKMAKEILRNTDRPVTGHRTDAEWLKSHTGKNIRFEVIGTLLCLFSLAAFSLPNSHALFRTLGTSFRPYSYSLGLGAEQCQEICQDMAIVNEFTLNLYYHMQVAQSLYRGDDSGFYWRKSGHVATCVTALGFHQENTILGSAPLMVGEIRKRVFAACFVVDKQLATLFGRPPRLSRRYSNCSLPLDLEDEEIMLQGDARAEKLSKLDAKGWNTEGRLTKIGCRRANMIGSLIRDEVLELCLGPEGDCTPEKREDVKRKSEEAFASLPDQFRFSRDRDAPSLTNVQLSNVIGLKLEFLFNRYLLDRLPTEDASQNKQSLIDTAVEILGILVLFFGRDDCAAGGLFVCASRLSVYFGIPSAGVLAVELLKQHQYPRRYALSLPRSRVVQDLSVFNHYLGTVEPCNGNHVICSRIHKVLGKVLDQVLEPVVAFGGLDGDEDVQMVQGGGAENGDPLPEPDMPAVMGPIDDLEFMEWMSGVDWTKGPWTESF